MARQPVIDNQQSALIRSMIETSQSISIVCHMAPDGDAMGSSLMLWHLLRAIGRKADVILPDMPPETLRFLPGVESLKVATREPQIAARILSDSDLIVCLDFNDISRIDKLGVMVENSTARRIVIDHHLNPIIEADLIVSRPEVSSTSALLYQVVQCIGYESYINLDAATCCCTGMMTDTGNFSYNSNDPELYTILSALIGRGVDKDAIYNRLFNTNSESRVRIMGYGQSEKMVLHREIGAAVICLSKEELDQFNYRKGDTEALVNVPLSIPGVNISVFLREDEPGRIKVSMRSQGDFSVKELCERYFGGGGHRNAAGGETDLPLQEAAKLVVDMIKEAIDYRNNDLNINDNTEN